MSSGGTVMFGCAVFWAAVQDKPVNLQNYSEVWFLMRLREISGFLFRQGAGAGVLHPVSARQMQLFIIL